MNFDRLQKITRLEELWHLPEGTIVVCRDKGLSSVGSRWGFEKNVIYFGIKTEPSCFLRHPKKIGCINSSMREDAYFVDCVLVSDSLKRLDVIFSHIDFNEFEFAILNPRRTVELFVAFLELVEKVKAITSILPKKIFD